MQQFFISSILLRSQTAGKSNNHLKERVNSKPKHVSWTKQKPNSYNPMQDGNEWGNKINK